MNTIGIGMLSALGALILLGDRRWSVLAMAAGIVYLTLAQYIVVGGFTLYPMRLLLLAAALRIVLRREFRTTVWNRIDRSLFLLYVFSVAVFCLRSDEGVNFQIGWGLDAVLGYAAFRILIRSVEDFRWLLHAFVPVLAPFALFVCQETLTYQNRFASLGGVELAAWGDAWVREGRLRATGSFGHPSLAGTVGGTFLPIYLGLLFSRPASKVLAVLGAGLCLAIVWAANSGGPVTCVAACFTGWALWPMRRSMQVVRRILLLTVIGLALVMNAPIWYLLARISDVTGGGGFHRAALMDVAFQNLDRWWLAGMSMRETRHWLPYTNTATGVVDLTNNYLNFGIVAGLGAMGLFIALLTLAYSHLGQAMSLLRTFARSGVMSVEPLFWGMGVMLTVHAVNWFGITYWDQSGALWFLHIAAISSVCAGLVGSGAAAKDSPPPQSKVDASTPSRIDLNAPAAGRGSRGA